ncbi:bifunctional adenosylcobinamide kinase/adenosylcobinamide-phosphate guanylyltransferase [uncultured Cohaesibacter sp.]|uniref:bifunctional adenosylcobinamide kinase/adenosylcobinamide-phosphate guanylyltransferase n=1 Tax=uncultured Cohaesibacter sp. TaxID=1002546 RepID=UPI0029311144|nr:bifunctional adenosylcobinamide kinase/adenosylcobinamide-phosphate guanylyltransferase [uncultured Cohaesibacter sp.]
MTSTLVIGGARSGKSAFAEKLCEDSDQTLHYIATSPRFENDPEMVARIEQHRQRRGARWTLHEEEIEIAGLVEKLNQTDNAILIDCATLWLNNLIYHQKPLQNSFDELEISVKASKSKLIIISNEIGQGVVPGTAEGRAFRDHQGRLNQMLAQCCNRVIEVRFGLPILLKPTPQPEIRL